MSDHPMVQALHAAISRRSWHDVEQAANRIRDHRGIGWPDLNGQSPHEGVKPRWECGARQRHIGAEVQDCDWPGCGCDPYASKVLDAIAESGFKIVRDDPSVPNGDRQ